MALSTTIAAAGCAGPEDDVGRVVSASAAECLGDAAALTEDARQSLAGGEKVMVPMTNLTFITEFFTSYSSASSVLEATEQDPEARRAAANAAAIVTSRGVDVTEPGEPQTEDAVEALDDSCFSELERHTGDDSSVEIGLESLPESMNRALTTQAFFRSTGEYNLLAPMDAAPTLDDLVDTSTLISAADNDLVSSSDIPVKLVERVSELAAGMRLSHGNQLTMGDGSKITDYEVASEMSRILGDVGTNRETVWRILAGDARKETATRVSDTVFAPLLAFDWDESAREQQPIIDALSAVSDPTLLFPETDDESPATEAPGADKRSSVASSDLMTIVGRASDEFLDVPGRDGASLGALNPEITEALAHAIGPQLFSMTGGLDDELEFASARPVDKDAYVGAFAVLGTSSESFQTMWTYISEAQSLIFVSYGRAHEGDPDRYVHPDEHSAAVNRLKDGAKELVVHSAPEMLAEGRMEELLELLGEKITYDPKRSFFYDRPVRKDDDGRDFIRPISNSTVVIVSPLFRERDSEMDKYRKLEDILASDNDREFEETFLKHVQPPHYQSAVAELSMLSTIPSDSYLDNRQFDDEVLEQLSDLTTIDMSREWSSESDAVGELIRDMVRPFFEYDR